MAVAALERWRGVLGTARSPLPVVSALFPFPDPFPDVAPTLCALPLAPSVRGSPGGADRAFFFARAAGRGGVRLSVGGTPLSTWRV